MTARAEDVVALLTSIDASLKIIAGAVQQRAAKQAHSPALASAADLDGPHGDPIIVAKDPRDWSGETMKGRKFSECPPEYLALVADRLDYFAQHNTEAGDAKKAGYNRKDAARARGWEERIRAGYTPPAPVAADEIWPSDDAKDDEVTW
jgi:hypothetical protein